MKNNVKSPVFFDPDKRRWRRATRIVEICALIFSLILGVFAVSVLINPVLPELGLPESPHSHVHQNSSLPNVSAHTNKDSLKEDSLKDKIIRGSLLEDSNRPDQNSPNRSANSSPGRALVTAYYVSDDNNSITSFKQNIDSIDILFPVWLRLGDSQGDIIKNFDRRVIDYINEKHSDIQVMPVINNFDQDWEVDKLAALLANQAARSRFIIELINTLKNNHFAGINIDFENIPEESQPAMLNFMSELYQALHPLGLKVVESLPAANNEYDYKAYAAVNDYIVVMNYDQHWNSSEPGPIAGQNWFDTNLTNRCRDIGADKLLMGIGSYGYDWTIDKKPVGQEVSFQRAVVTASESEGIIGFDADTLNPNFEYYDEEERRHEVWFLDGVTGFNEISASQRNNLAGYSLWRLGTEDPSLWRIVSDFQENSACADRLRSLNAGYDVDYDNEGEILSVATRPTEGKRSLELDQQSGLIKSESYNRFPTPYLIKRYGKQPKKIALTFDDGPDAEYTPKILDILKQYQVPGAFFVIGINAEENVSLLRRIINEGHEIGNHTFTHPNIADIPAKQFEMELTSAQRLFESELGRRTLLFRAPYAVDSEPDTPDQVMPLKIAEDLGYKTVGEAIDPKDWDRNNSADKIVQSVLEQEDRGNVLLLHDGGGDRSQTILALPRIITELRARGYQFVPISALLGKQRDDLMPPLPTGEIWQARINRLTFNFFKVFGEAMHYLFMIGIILGIGRLLVIGSLALWQRRQRRKEIFPGNFHPPVSVIVPAYNEEKVIVQTIQSLLESDYANFEIIIVDDGSNDNTFSVVKQAFRQQERVRVFTKRNGGKADALDFGLSKVNAEIVIALDADTIFKSDTISKLVRHFAQPDVGAVAGNAKVGNRINLLTRWQAMEYITSQNLDRRAFDALNCITVVPGAVGAWRAELIRKVGGFPHETLAEDADLTISIRRLGYRIVYDDVAIALTEAPDTVRNLVKQRFRWSFGTLQTIWKHRATLGRKRYGALGTLALPNILIFQILFPLFSPLIDLMMIGSLVISAFQKWQHPDTFMPDSLYKILFFYMLFVAIDYFTCVLAFMLEKEEDWHLIIWLFWQRFCYRQIMYYVAIKSILTAIKGIAVGWGKLERKATVNS